MVILIEKHFKPICSRITSTNHSANKLKAMIREMGNVELFELCETIPKVQCSECLLHWNQGMLKESEASQHFHQWRLDVFSIENYVIKKERHRGARHGRTEAQKEHFIAHNARWRCLKKKFDAIYDRSQKTQHIVIQNWLD